MDHGWMKSAGRGPLFPGAQRTVLLEQSLKSLTGLPMLASFEITGAVNAMIFLVGQTGKGHSRNCAVRKCE